MVGVPEADEVRGRPHLLAGIAHEAVRGLLAVVAEVVEDERVRREGKQDEGRHEARRQPEREARQPAARRREADEGEDRRREDEPRVDGEAEQQAGGEPARPVAALDGDEGAEQEEARERERLDDPEVAEDEAGKDVERERRERRHGASAARDVEVEERAGRDPEQRRERADRVPRLAEDADPGAVDVRQERHLLVEEVAVGDVAVEGEPRGVGVDALVPVHEPEDGERSEDERLRGDRERRGDARDSFGRHAFAGRKPTLGSGELQDEGER